MPTTGDEAPTFTAPLANGSIAEFNLTDRLSDEAPIVLAFFPGAFTAVCTSEMQSFEERLEDIDGTVYGVSVDSPFSLNEFRDQHDLSFGLISDFEKEIIDAYDVRTDFADLGVHGLAARSVFVIEDVGTITYEWVSDDPGVEPEYDEVAAAVDEAR